MKHSTLLLSLLLGMTSLNAENWPQFRGAAGDGLSHEKNIPVQWSPSAGIRWKAPLPGEGHSSPIIWESTVWVTAAVKETGERLLIRLDGNTGKEVWRKVVFKSPIESMHRENSSASSTPATDGKFVFTSFQNGDRADIRCFDIQGKEIWAQQPLSFSGEHGYSYSPILYEDLVIFDCRQEGEAALLALDKKSGKLKWKAEPSIKRISHIPPVIISHQGKQQLVVSGSNETRAYEPLTGKPIWWCKGPSDVSVAGLSWGDGLIMATAGYPARTRIGVKMDGKGDVTQTHVAWSSRRQVPYVPSPVFHEGHFYGVLDEGMAVCFKASTGETVWEERLPGRFRSSLVLAEGRVYATDDKSNTTIFSASPAGFKSIAKNSLNEFCYATPAISDGTLYLRTSDHLYAIGHSKK